MSMKLPSSVKTLHRLFKSRYVNRRLSYARVQLLGLSLFSIGTFFGLTLAFNRYIIPLIFASDTTQSWNFASAGDYTLSDDTLVEVAASSARLKVRNYSSDANTALLLHLDESSGNPTDSSSNAHTVTASSVSYAAGSLNNAADLNGTSSYISVPDASSLSFTQNNTLEAWTKFDEALSAGSHSQRQGIVDKGDYQLYYDNETGKIVYELADSSETSWTQVAGNDINNTWDLDGQLAVHAQESIGTDLYVALGNAVGDAEVWKWSSSTWTKVGGDGLNSGWASGTFESGLGMVSDGTNLFVGIGTTAGDAEVWRYTVASNTWSKIGGDAVNSSWAVNTFEAVYALYYQSSTVYAALGNSTTDAEVWSYNGSTWTKIGGDGTSSSWNTNYEIVHAITGDGTNLYAGLGTTAGDAEVWRYNGSTWSQIGGDTLNSSWANSTFESVFSMTYMSSNLYVGLGVTANDAEVWRYNGSTWSQIGGDSLNSGWTTNYEGVYSLTNDGTYVYAGLGVSAGDNEVYRWSPSGGTWSKIGGDGTNSSFTGTNHIAVETLEMNGSTLYAGITSAATNRSGEVWSFNGTTWTQIGGNFVNSSWGFRGLQSVEAMYAAGGYLYAGTGVSSAGNAQVWRSDGSTWTLIGGQGVNSSWAAHTYESVMSMISAGTNLYVALGTGTNEAEIWSWNGSTWTQVGGDGLNSSWNTSYEEIPAMAVIDGTVYAGLGNGAGDAEVYSYNGSTWSKIGGDSLNSGWTTNYDRVTSMAVYGGLLYVGLGSTAGEAEVWRWSGSAWTKVGGDTTNSSWNSTDFEQVDAMIVYNNTLYAGLGTTTGDADVWSFNGSTWTKIGGDDLNSGWTSGTYERVRGLVGYNGDLYAGLGNGTGEGEVWRWNGSSWSQTGGDSLNSSWTNAIEEVTSFSVYKGKLYAGIGNTQNVDTAIWSYGNNRYLQSSASSQDTNWHHIAATYDGTTMRIYIDGTLDTSQSASVTMPDSSRAVLLGVTYAGREAGRSPGYFEGMLDEIRISNTHRSSFISTPYSSDGQTVRPAAAVYTSGVKNFDQFSTSETANGGTITYRLSSDAGSTWKYYNSGWVTSSSTSQTNSAATINSNIATFPVTSQGIVWQAVLDGNGSQQVTLNSVTIGALTDNSAPTNPTSLTALSQSGGSAITTNTWYSHTAPTFSWSGADDGSGAGVAGYFVYFGSDTTADPSTAGSFQAGASYTPSSLVSGTTYYLRIKTKDNAQNTAADTWAPFIYKFDNTAPTNPSSITVSPAGYASSNSFTFSWPAGSDTGSGLAGYQYKTATASGSLSDWSTATTSASVVLDSAAYQTDSNTFYLRTVDNAGNVNGSPISTQYFFAGNGPTAPRFLNVSPSSNTSNSFAFSWTQPESFSGSASDLTYCYTVNTLPTSNTCTFTSAGATSLSASSFATQVGLNIFYLVAKNPANSGGAINYGSYASVSFTANTSAPGIPLNTDIADVSVKSTSSWKLALSWERPSNVGSGVASYEIYRSADNVSFSKIASTTGIAYVDTGLTQQTYYYKVRACDSVANCGAYSEVVELYPDGKYDTSPSLSSGPTVSDITTKKATISWVTDRASDTKVQYGTSAGTYFASEPSNSTQKVDHEIELTNLSPGTTYYYKAKWTDEDGNTGTSSEKTFTTEPAPSVKDVTVKNAGLTTAILEFTSTGASKVKIYYGETTAFGGVKSISTSTAETTYTAELDELADGTKYYYKINLLDAEGSEYEGTILSFTTLPRPKISTVRIQQVKNTAQPTVLVSWQTNTPTSSIVTYYPEGQPSQARDEVNVNLQTGEHRMIVRSLSPQTPYVLVVKGRDKAGNEAVSEPQKFTTATDTRPALISNLKVEGGIQNASDDSQEALAQLVVSWTTDEPTTSQVEYAEGTGTTYSQKTQEDGNLTINHLVVITGLSPSKVYHLRALSKDSAGNVTQSIDTVTITPKATDRALDLVMTNLFQVFSFLGSNQ